MPKRRHHTLEFKRQVVAAANQPGVSVAAVALEYQINGNLLHTWRRQLAQIDAEGNASACALLPVTVLPEAVSTISAPVPDGERPSRAEGTIEIQLPRATVLVRGAIDVAVLESALRVLSRC